MAVLSVGCKKVNKELKQFTLFTFYISNRCKMMRPYPWQKCTFLSALWIPTVYDSLNETLLCIASDAYKCKRIHLMWEFTDQITPYFIEATFLFAHVLNNFFLSFASDVQFEFDFLSYSDHYYKAQSFPLHTSNLVLTRYCLSS